MRIKIGIYTLEEIISNYQNTNVYKNADEAFKDFVRDYDEELSGLEGEFDRHNIEGKASCLLNDYYSKK